MVRAQQATAGVQQRTLDTRRQILDAAVEVLIGWGYSGATTLRIQELAGVSRGRLLHHFPSRDSLLVAAVQHLASVRIEGLAERTTWPDDATERVSAAVDTMWATYQQPYFWASMELWLAARHSDTLREELLPHERHLGALVRRTTDALFGQTLTSHPKYPALRDMLIASMRGVALSYALEPHDPASEPQLNEWKHLAVTVLGLAPVAPERRRRA